jgi:hypothetical protein
VLLHVGDDRVDLRVLPVDPDRRHRSGAPGGVDALLEDPEERRPRGDERARADVGAVAALSEVPMTRRADACPFLPADRLPGGRRDVGLVGLLRLDLDDGRHGGVIDAAELRALALVTAGSFRLEPDVVVASRDRLDLPAESRNPPAVDDIRRVDGEIDDPADGDMEGSDRSRPARILELPVVLVPDDSDRDRVVGRRGIVDLRQLDEDDDADHAQDHDGNHRPDQLEARVAVHLRSFDGPGTAAGAVLPDERDEQSFDEDEDRRGEAEDDVVGRLGVARVGRFGRHGREAAVRGCGDSRRRTREQHDEHEGRQLATQPAGIL